MAQSTQDASVSRLWSAALRIPVERCVSAYLGRVWQVTAVESKSEAASHPAAILSDGIDAVFVKLGEGDLAADQFAQELAGLHLLTARAGVLTPDAIGVVPIRRRRARHHASRAGRRTGGG